VKYRADLLNLRSAYELKLPHLMGGKADQAADAERQKKKHYPQANPLVRLQQCFCLNTNTRTGWEE
jgi:hypothetical protein